MRNFYKILFGKPEAKRPIRRRERNINRILQKYGLMVWNGFSWPRIWSSGELLRTR